MTIRKLLILSSLLAGCAVHKPSYSGEEKKWKENRSLPTKEVEYSMLFVGDMGAANSELGKRTLKLLDSKLKSSGERQGIVFLGDNIFPNGLPDSTDKRFAEAAALLDNQIDILKGYKGEIFYMPGEHDWEKYGRESLENQDDYIEERLNRKKIFQPDQGCPGPHESDLTDNVKIMIIDTQWYLENWDKDKNFNKDCEITSRSHFIEELADELRKSKDKTVILAMHHPLRTYGPHGGQNSVKNTLFPFNGSGHENYVPIPILGSFLKRHIGLAQDTDNPKYREMTDEIWRITKGMDNVIFVSGHEHSLQFIEDEDHKYIISGAGSRVSPARAGGFAKYTNGEGGFAEVRFFKDKSAWVYFWNSNTGEMEYAHEVIPAEEPIEEDFEEYYTLGKSVSRPLFTPDMYPGGFHRFLWGELNRPLYYDTITAPVLRLEDYGSGLKPVRKGGGNQTNSLRVIDSSGQTYVLRSVIKDGERVMGGVFVGTIVVDLLEDLFTYGHPFGAFALSPMADSANIYHTKPQLVYVPKQPGLGQFNRTFGGDFYLFEKRADGDQSAVDNFGNSKEVVNYADAMDELTDDYKKVLDQDWTVRSRAFDYMIGDWDRHQDNWRWATFKSDTGAGDYTIFRPIPRDRDQVFSRFDGPLLQIFNKTIPMGRQFQTFESDVKRVKWYGEFPKFYDRRFIGPIEWSVWEEQVKYLQKHVSDSIIEFSIRQMPESAFEWNGEEIIEKIKTRRDNLLELTREYYLLLAKNVDILSTREDDRFLVERVDNDRTIVTVFSKDEEGMEHRIYHRTFFNNETDEIRLYGLEGDDIFEFTGKTRKGILIRVIGGYGNDSVSDQSKVSGLLKKTLVYDHPKGVEIDKSGETDDKTSKRYDYNNYEFKDFGRNYGLPMPILAYDPDFGLRLGISYTYNTYGFKRNPKASVQNFKLVYALGNQSISASYDGRFNNVFNYWGVIVNSRYSGEQFTINFFGLGNETEQDLDREREYYQIRQGEIYLAPGIIRPFGHDAGFLSIQPFYQRLNTQLTPSRFIDSIVLPNDQDLSIPVFDALDFVGAQLNFQYDTRNSFAEPTQGMLNKIRIRYTNTLGYDQENTSAMGTLAFYQRLDANDAWVLATQVGAEHVFGDYLFYQSAYVGGKSSIRGYREGRFRGRTAFWNSNDLRLNLGKVKNPVIPLSAGIFGSFDNGRIWIDDMKSNVWHYSTGGGIFINILNAATLTIGYHKGDDNGQFLGSFGFNF